MAAAKLYGKNSPQYRGVNTAFAKVGLDGTWKAPPGKLADWAVDW